MGVAFCLERKVDPSQIRDARGFEREKLKEDAVAALVVNDETRRQYLSLASSVDSLLSPSSLMLPLFNSAPSAMSSK